MSALRAFFRDHRHFAALLVAMALCMKALLPAGYMVGSGNPLGSSAKVLTVLVCADASGLQKTMQIAVPHDGKSGKTQGDYAKASAVCPFAALGMASLSGADILLLASALAFILALGIAPVTAPRPRRAFYLRPPLRGPPALA